MQTTQIFTMSNYHCAEGSRGHGRNTTGKIKQCLYTKGGKVDYMEGRLRLGVVERDTPQSKKYNLIC